MKVCGKMATIPVVADGKKHPTSAGILMFGNEYDIVQEFNTYFLDYQEQYDADTRWTDRIISSSGDFRIEVDAAKSGGVSDPRNGTMMKIFNLIDIGERSGRGIPLIFGVWQEQGWRMPVVTEQLEPERTLLKLTFEKSGDKKSAIKIGDKKSAINTKMKETIVVYLSDHADAKASAIAAHIGLKPSRTRDYLNELMTEGLIVANGSNRNRTYRLKE